jgi:hypothetical protein
VSELKNSHTRNENFFNLHKWAKALGSTKLDNLLPYSTNWTVMMKFAKGPKAAEI